LLIPAVGLFAWFFISAGADEQREAVFNQAAHIGETFRALPMGFTGESNQAVESFLLLAADPPIERIAITDELGHNIVAAVKPPSAKAYLNEDSQDFTPPGQYAATNKLFADEVSRWLPIKSANGGRYWITVKASFKDINRREAQQLLFAFGVLAVLFGVLTPLSMVKARQTQKALRAAAEFAGAISTQPNSELQTHSGNIDLDNLVTALNRLSKNWHHRLQISEQNAAYLRMHKVAIDLHSAVCITNGNGRIEYVNKHFCIASGYTDKELVGKNISLLNSGYHDDHFFKDLWRSLAIGRVWQGELCNRNKRGETYWVKCTIAPIKDQGGRLCQYIAIQTPSSAAQHVDYIANVK
jgi:PAS domain S-box-containing protein